MNLKLEKQVEDKRGKILFFSLGDKKFNLVETKRGFARGGHYHNFPSIHILINGKIEVKEENLNNGVEQSKKISAPSIISVDKNIAHVFLAIDDSVFVEIFEGKYQAIDHPKYRKIVEELAS
tara:strand:+ start:1032 stop:1397 length:366 start_codon:yes stop_codon:yes gene_type:complete